MLIITEDNSTGEWTVNKDKYNDKSDFLIPSEIAKEILELQYKENLLERCCQMIQVISTRGVTLNFNTVEDENARKLYILKFTKLMKDIRDIEDNFLFDIMEKLDKEIKEIK